MKIDVNKYPYPRRRVIRTILRNLINLAFTVLGDFEIIGKENLPKSGPLLVVSNHFSFLDPLAVINLLSWRLEFLGGTRTPNAPGTVEWLRHLWGIIPVFRGSVSRDTFIISESVLAQNGILGIFPEGGSWANVLRPARPGVAFLAAKTSATILPIGLDGFDTFFSKIRQFKRPKVTARIGKPFGPYQIDVKNRTDRLKLDEIGHDIMIHISRLLPPEKHGYYSNDPDIREAAKGTEIYPWETMQEV
ncbi:MAG: 1-acyl-sn-glycerol-3-phosphate acyltransferase [Anaerolineaceae bacterium]|nr:1-acyl-sn-glycerol-3-phosphate acyltransferase [Anaerolineaceae bacterium]